MTMMNGGAQMGASGALPKASRDAGALVVQTGRARDNADRLESFCVALDTSMERVYGAEPKPTAPGIASDPPKQVSVGALGDLANVNNRMEHLLNWLAVLNEKIAAIA